MDPTRQYVLGFGKEGLFAEEMQMLLTVILGKCMEEAKIVILIGIEVQLHGVLILRYHGRRPYH